MHHSSFFTIVFLCLIIPLSSCEKEKSGKDTAIGTPILLSPDSLKAYVDTISANPVLSDTFIWESTIGASKYEVVFDSVESSNKPIIDTFVIQPSVKIVKSGLPDHKYYWKVRAIDSKNIGGNWSYQRPFSIKFTKFRPSIVPSGAKVQKMTTGTYSFLEGVTWTGNSGLYFNDINGSASGTLGHSVNRIKDGTETMLNSASRNANGMYFDSNSQLFTVCVNQAGAGYIATMTLSGVYKDTLISQYNGNNFNMPNDLDVDNQGGVYFTDPTWNSSKPQPVNGVYYCSADKHVSLLVSDMKKPNGIILSPDQKTLYIDDWDGIDIWAYDVTAPGIISNKRSFTKLAASSGTNSGADGVAIDINGNLYVAVKAGIQIFSPDGKTISTISVPENPTNCTFGGANMKTLYISAGKNIYFIELNTVGIR